MMSAVAESLFISCDLSTAMQCYAGSEAVATAREECYVMVNLRGGKGGM